MGMDKPSVKGFYWINTKTKRGEGWEIAEFDGENWWVFGREYSYTSEEIGVVCWEGPLSRG